MRIGVDLGGTKIEAIAIDDEGTTLSRKRVQTPAGNYPGILGATCDLVQDIERGLLCEGTVGVGCPGAPSLKTGLVKNANSTVLNGKPLDRDLADRLGRPVRIENDANCFALSEAIDGAARGHKVVFGVILGTGVGGGIVVGRTPISGRNHIAGEWGHNPLPWPSPEEYPGPKCYCGKTGCIETFLSGPALAREYRTLTGRDLTAKEISLAASNGDLAALNCLAVYENRLARSLALLLNVLDPDIIVLGGGLSNIGGIYSNIQENIQKYAFSDAVETDILPALHGDSSGVRGAAWLWPVAQSLDP